MSATLIDNPSMNQRMSINFIIKMWRKFNMKFKKKTIRECRFKITICIEEEKKRKPKT